MVVVLRKGGRLLDEWVMQALGRETARFRFEVIPIWEVDAREIVAQGLMGLYPLLPLMQWEDREAEAALEESQNLVLGIEDREERADAYVALRVLSGIVHPEPLVRRILRRREIMLESPFYKEILEEGKELGQEEGLRESVLDVLEIRFELVPFEMEKKVRQVRGRKTLEGLLRRAILVESLEAFGEALSRVQTLSAGQQSSVR